jgi:ActR/RegA family two-component response regulator
MTRARRQGRTGVTPVTPAAAQGPTPGVAVLYDAAHRVTNLPCAVSDAPATLPAENPSLLIVDDDPLIVDSLKYFLGREFAIVSAETRSEALKVLGQRETLPVAALVDLGLPPTPHRPDEGFALIAELLARAPDIRIVVLSGQNDAANARHARVLGAADFVAKPAEPLQLLHLLKQLLAVNRETAPGAVAAADALLIGQSAPMQKLRLQLRQYANSPFPVLIEGESGSGKELAANALHHLSERAARPYFALNCAAIAPSLVEPTLFGHAKGAFTGAAGARAGGRPPRRRNDRRPALASLDRSNMSIYRHACRETDEVRPGRPVFRGKSRGSDRLRAWHSICLRLDTSFRGDCKCTANNKVLRWSRSRSCWSSSACCSVACSRVRN